MNGDFMDAVLLLIVILVSVGLGMYVAVILGGPP
jgi:hypothetical protein